MYQYFAVGPKKNGPFTAHTALGVCWFVAGCITSVLFFTTSGTLPRSTVLGHDSVRDNRLPCDGLGHRIVAVQVPEQPHDPEAPVTRCKTVFRDGASGIELAAIDNFMGGRLSRFWIDPLHNLLAIDSAACGGVKLYSWPACVSLRTRLETGLCYHLAFSPDGMRVVTRANEGIKEWDRVTGAELGSWNPAGLRDEAWSCPQVYYDHANQPKLVRITDTTIQRWDLRSGTLDYCLKPTCEIYDGEKESWLFCLNAEHDLLACVLSDNEIGLWSLQHGNLLRSFPRPSGLDNLEFSADAGFLAYRRERGFNKSLQNCLYKVSPGLERIYMNRLYNSGIIALGDTRAGTNWAFPSGDYCEFADDAVRVYSWNGEEFGHEYDLPPRWQYLTPWAWTALGAWIGLSVFLRRMQRRPGPAAVA